ncbi:MAG: hypothetical protein ABIA04_13145 [Pseudomonadota bacterium]
MKKLLCFILSILFFSTLIYANVIQNKDEALTVAMAYLKTNEKLLDIKLVSQNDYAYKFEAQLEILPEWLYHNQQQVFKTAEIFVIKKTGIVTIENKEKESEKGYLPLMGLTAGSIDTLLAINQYLGFDINNLIENEDFMVKKYENYYYVLFKIFGSRIFTCMSVEPDIDQLPQWITSDPNNMNQFSWLTPNAYKVKIWTENDLKEVDDIPAHVLNGLFLYPMFAKTLGYDFPDQSQVAIYSQEIEHEFMTNYYAKRIAATHILSEFRLVYYLERYRNKDIYLIGDGNPESTIFVLSYYDNIYQKPFYGRPISGVYEDENGKFFESILELILKGDRIINTIAHVPFLYEYFKAYAQLDENAMLAFSLIPEVEKLP